MTRSDPSLPLSSAFRLERRRLLDVLRSLDASDWARPTRCPGWTVHGLSLHLLGDDLSFLSWQRDEHRGTPAPATLDETGFIDWLDALQVEWVDAARRLSPQLVIDLLEWADAPIAETVDRQDPSSVDSSVSWAGTQLVPRWLDQVRELSERWVHRQQILEALGRPVDLDQDLFRPVLDGLRWAYPYRLSHLPRDPGTVVTVAITGPDVVDTWTMVSAGSHWLFTTESDVEPAGGIDVTTDQSWRLLTNNLDAVEHGRPRIFGDAEITEVLLRTRAIIGHPK